MVNNVGFLKTIEHIGNQNLSKLYVMIVVMKSVVSKVLKEYRASWHFSWALGAVSDSLIWIYVYSLCKKYYSKKLDYRNTTWCPLSCDVDITIVIWRKSIRTLAETDWTISTLSERNEKRRKRWENAMLNPSNSSWIGCSWGI